METSKDHINFLQNEILSTIERMHECGLEKISCLYMAQTIELIGAYIDNKPMRAKAQSAKRFSIALNAFFDSRYTKLNRSNRLYYQLRANFVHTLLPTDKLKILPDSKEKLHLQEINGVINIVPSILFKDVSFAIHNLIKKLDTGSLNPKKISSGY